MTTPTIALPPGKEPCTRCDAGGVVRPDNRPCPRCRGRRYEPTPRSPWVPLEQLGSLHGELVRLGKLREAWRDSRSGDAAERREEIRAEIQRAVAGGRAEHVRDEDMADALGVSRYHLQNIMRGDPSRKRR